MLIVKTFLFAAIALLLASLASGVRSRRSLLSRMLVNDERPVRARKRDRESDPWYFEQCRSAYVWKEQLGRVSVLAFLDPAWQYSFRQAVMLKLLSARLQRSGFPDVRFYVIAPPHDLTEDRLENELEIQAWREIPEMYESADLASEANDRHPDRDGESSEMIFVQDDPRTRVWERFRASKDQVVVVDRCGQLTYQVMVPWSILYFPYVKAAILSTYREDPCGACDFHARTDASSADSSADDEREEASVASSSAAVDGTTGSSSAGKSRYDDGTATESSTYRENGPPSTEDTRSREQSTDSANGELSDPDPARNESTMEEVATEMLPDDAVAGEESRDDDRDDDSADGESPLPLRIILQAPHVHRDRWNKTRKHTHLILKIGNPNYHGHLPESGADVVAPPSTDSRQAGVDHPTTGSEEHDWEGTEVNANDESANQKFTYDRDESPGLYGEVADYWRSFEDSDITDRNETSNDNYSNSTISYNEEHRSDISGHAAVNSSAANDKDCSTTKVTTDANAKNPVNDPQNIVESDESDFSKDIEADDQLDKEEEMRNRLIEHYSKLLPWIYYILNK